MGSSASKINQTFQAGCMEICSGRLRSEAADRLQSALARPLTQTKSFKFNLQFCLLNPNVSPMNWCACTGSSDYVTNCESPFEMTSIVYYPSFCVGFHLHSQNMHIRLTAEMWACERTVCVLWWTGDLSGVCSCLSLGDCWAPATPVTLIRNRE